MGTNEAAIEAEIQRKGLNAPRLTPDLIDATIVGEAFHVFPGTTLTVCALTLRNGFQVTGESAAASPANFDEELGRKIARENARNKIWALGGYLLRSRLAEAGNAATHTSDCRLHDGPANEPGPCSCGADPSMTPERYGSEYPAGSANDPRLGQTAR